MYRFLGENIRGYQISRHAIENIETFLRGRSRNRAIILQCPNKRLIPFFPRKFRMTIDIGTIEGRKPI